LSEAARVVRPGGVVLVVDFSPHDLVELKREHAHVHLGFADNQVQGWLKSAGLNPLEPIHFPGRRIMTGIWRGEREVAERPNRPTALAHGASR
jgi:ArsR family transcriptional regulator